MAGKLGAGKRKPAGSGGNGRPLTTGDNGMAPAERAKAEEENKRLRYISGIRSIRVIQPKIDQAKAALKELTDQRKDVITDLTKDGHLKKEIEADLIDVGAVRRNVDAAEIARAKRRSWLGLPVGRSDEQLELEDRLPDAVRNAAHWKAAGYTAMISGGQTEPPKECQAEGFIDAWTEGVKDGIASNGKGIKQLAPKADPKPAEPEPGTPEAAKAEREAIERGKASLAAMKPVEEDDEKPPKNADDAAKVGDAPQIAVNPADHPGLREDDFEAPAEELAAQTTRKNVVDIRDAKTSGEAEEVV